MSHLWESVQGIKIWTEDELLSVIGAGVLVPVTSTEVVSEEDNINAFDDISIRNESGNVLSGFEVANAIPFGER